MILPFHPLADRANVGSSSVWVGISRRVAFSPFGRVGLFQSPISETRAN
jgi:hypothetical protein